MPAATRVQTGQAQLALNLAASALLLTLAATAGPLHADSAVEQDDGVYRTTVSGIDEFHAVIELLRAELFERGFTEQDVTDVDIMLRSEGQMIHNKIVVAYDPERIADAIAKRPLTTMLAGHRILVYQEKPEEPESYRAEPGDIVISAIDPAALAEALDIDDPASIEAMGEDLKAALEATHAFFKGPESAGIIESPDEAAGNGNNDN